MAFLVLLVFLKEYNKTPEVIFHIRLHTLWLSSSLIREQYLYANFLSAIENLVVCCPSFLLLSSTRLQLFLTIQKSRRAEKNFHNTQSLQENNVRSAANQSAHTIVAI